MRTALQIDLEHLRSAVRMAFETLQHPILDKKFDEFHLGQLTRLQRRQKPSASDCPASAENGGGVPRLRCSQTTRPL